MNVYVTKARNCIAALLPLAEAEIETRIACLKDAGPDRAEFEKEIGEGQEVLAVARSIIEG